MNEINQKRGELQNIPEKRNVTQKTQRWATASFILKNWKKFNISGQQNLRCSIHDEAATCTYFRS